MQTKTRALVISHAYVAALAVVMALTPGALAQCENQYSPYGINAHAPQGSDLAPLLDAVQTCGIGWIRIDFVWSWVEPAQDSFTWTMYDNLVAAASARGIHIYATIGNTPAWATAGAAGTGPPANPADWYDVCFRAAQRYRGSIEHWGMWNEPDLSQFWTGTRAQYINDILRNGADAVHAVNSSAKACGPELAHLSSANWDDWLTDAINQAGTKLDIVTHHVYSSSYSGCTDKLEKAPFWPWDPPSLKEVLQSTGWYGRPVWITETGWQSSDAGEASQASNYTGFLNDWFTGQSGRTWISRVFFYELNDTQVFANNSFGILGPDPSYPHKAAFTAYQSFITAHPPPPAPPMQVGNPSPADGAGIVGLSTVLSWSAAGCANSYKVYFGTTSPGSYRGSQPDTSFNPGPLAWAATYFWRVDSVGPGGTTTGQTWSFSTPPFPGDFDLDGDVDQGDFGRFQACLSGFGKPYAAGCGDADLDGDGDVDQGDVDRFRACFSGANVRPPENCGT